MKLRCTFVLIAAMAGSAAAGEPGAQSVRNSVGMTFAHVASGKFMMGSEASDPMAAADEHPLHAVRITRPFYLGMHEVTQKEYVSWDDAQRFCRLLSVMPQEKAAGRSYRLPTEAEWEYAARAGAEGHGSAAPQQSSMNDFAWYASNAKGQSHPVGQKAINAWGLYDMSGNVAEWCADGYAGDYYAKSPSDDPTGPERAGTRVFAAGRGTTPRRLVARRGTFIRQAGSTLRESGLSGRDGLGCRRG